MHKKCNVCMLLLDKSQFSKRSASPDGLNYTCKACAALRNRKWRQENPDGFRKWHEKNLGHRKKYWAEWSEKNKDRLSMEYAKWVDRNRAAVYASNAARVAAKIRATPAWADKGKIQKIYERAVELTAQTGIRHEVDHFYPLRGKIVCGLHCEENLRVITRSENARKKNHMPSEVCA